MKLHTINRALKNCHKLPRTKLTVEELYDTLEDICKRLAKDISIADYTTIEDYLPKNDQNVLGLSENIF